MKNTYIIAEAGVNHNGNLDLALKLIEEAKKAKADCVKFQTFKASNLVTLDAPKAEYQLKVTDKSESQFKMLSSLELKKSDYKKLIKYCDELKIDFMSTPYNKEDVDYLFDLKVKSFKIASGQLTEIPFLEYVASFGLPIYLSTGMSYFSEVIQAIESIKSVNSNLPLTILQCTTNYPSLIEDANINVIKTFKSIPNISVGYSDHVQNNFACYAAVANGAEVIEKHFTIDKDMEGPDHSSSLDPKGFLELVNSIREIEKSMGSYIKEPSTTEKLNIFGMKRSLVYSKSISKGEILKEHHFAYKRPFNGLSPSLETQFIGKKLKTNVELDDIVSFEHI
jgi:N-acetylneuraminate synthase/N,N'-diacetyllegionaminate synthase